MAICQRVCHNVAEICHLVDFMDYIMSSEYSEKISTRITAEAKKKLSLYMKENELSQSSAIDQLIHKGSGLNNCFKSEGYDLDAEPISKDDINIENVHSVLKNIENIVKNIQENPIKEALNAQVKDLLLISELAPKVSSISSSMDVAKRNIIEAAKSANDPFEKAISSVDISTGKLEESYRKVTKEVSNLADTCKDLEGSSRDLKEKLNRECFRAIKEESDNAIGEIKKSSIEYKKAVSTGFFVNLIAIALSVFSAYYVFKEIGRAHV